LDTWILCIGFFSGVSIFIGSFFLVKATINSSLTFHRAMLHRLLRAPMWFFDTTPIGRIINRFGKDVDICDSTLPLCMRFWIIGFFQVFQLKIVCGFPLIQSNLSTNFATIGLCYPYHNQL